MNENKIKERNRKKKRRLDKFLTIRRTKNSKNCQIHRKKKDKKKRRLRNFEFSNGDFYNFPERRKNWWKTNRQDKRGSSASATNSSSNNIIGHPDGQWATSVFSISILRFTFRIFHRTHWPPLHCNCEGQGFNSCTRKKPFTPRADRSPMETQKRNKPLFDAVT